MEKPNFEQIVHTVTSRAKNVGAFLMGLTQIPGIVDTLDKLNKAAPLLSTTSFEATVHQRSDNMTANYLQQHGGLDPDQQ